MNHTLFSANSAASDSEKLQGLFNSDRDGLQLDDYDYPLAEALIARYPLPERDASRMLVLNRADGSITHTDFRALPSYLNAGDLLVLNNTKVLPVRFYGNRVGFTGRVEILLLHPDGDDSTIWSALLRPARKLKPGTVIEFAETQATMTMCAMGERGCGKVRIDPAEHGNIPTFMEKVGLMPIPPYLRRDPEAQDSERYQTVFAKVPGAQAAPTASLHFTEAILNSLQAKGVNRAEVTLSVSAGTFRTVESEDIRAHQMDPEFYTLPEETAAQLSHTRAQGGRIVAVGTTVTKTLETAMRNNKGVIGPSSGWSDLYIYPGFQYQLTDVLLTNFHLPKSTLLMLISAFAGRDIVAKAYRAALDEAYRFYSYGDCMLIL